MEDVVITITVAIGLLIAILIHLSGMAIAARLFGVHVERMSIGYSPRAFGWRFGHTDICVSWIPLGGYVRLAGMIDDDPKAVNTLMSPKPWEYRSKPALVRIAIILFGPASLIALASILLRPSGAWHSLLSTPDNFNRLLTRGFNETVVIPLRVLFASGFGSLLGVLSIKLAFLNLLPIPGLNGGQIVLIILEDLLGVTISQNVKLIFQMIGLLLFLFFFGCAIWSVLFKP